MLFKSIVVAILLVIIFSMGTALVAMFKNDDSTKMVKALTIRIGLSIGLLIFLLIGYQLGFITPHSV